jgi:hypothetical protein
LASSKAQPQRRASAAAGEQCPLRAPRLQARQVLAELLTLAVLTALAMLPRQPKPLLQVL